MATAIQRRRGTTTQHGSFTGLAGEITIDTTKNTVVVHDGSTAGGIPLAKSSEVAALGGADITAVVAGNGLSGGSTSGDATINLDLNELSAAAVAVDADSIPIIDASDNSSKKESIADLVSGMAGTNLTASSGTLGMADTVIRGKISVTDAGGDGSLAYNNSTGVITYTGPSAAEVRAHISGGTGVTVSSGEISIGQAVATTSDVTFADVIISGNLTVSGTQTTVNTETLTVDDNIIVLNNNESGTPSQDAGIEVERGTSTNVKLQYDEGTDKWQFTNDGSTYNDILTVTQVEALLSVTDAGGDGSLAYNNTTGVFTYTGPSAAEVRAHISGSTGIDISAGAISIDATVATLTGSQTLTNKTLTSPVLNTGVSGTAIVDEDNMASDSASKIPTQQSVKAYVDAQVASVPTGDITAVTAGDGLSGGGTSGAVSLALDLNELTAAAVDVTADSFAMIDGGDNSSKKESVSDLVAAMAGTNLTASSGTLGIASRSGTRAQSRTGSRSGTRPPSGVALRSLRHHQELYLDQELAHHQKLHLDQERGHQELGHHQELHLDQELRQHQELHLDQELGHHQELHLNLELGHHQELHLDQEVGHHQELHLDQELGRHQVLILCSCRSNPIVAI